MASDLQRLVRGLAPALNPFECFGAIYGMTEDLLDEFERDEDLRGQPEAVALAAAKEAFDKAAQQLSPGRQDDDAGDH